MGIKGLSKLLQRYAPNSMKDGKIDQYFGRVVAIDASILVYQFISAVRDQEGSTLVNEYGETTSHIIGTFYRTIKLMTSGVKPIYVFDGKPPEMKTEELKKRQTNAKEAIEKLEKAKESGDKEEIKKQMKRTARMTKEQSDDVKKLVELMGIPAIEANCEAEGTCAELVKSGKCFATATEDMDALTLGSDIVLRKFSASDNKKEPIREYSLKSILEETGFTMDMFIDLCILLGCDYCETIKGIGPVTAFEMIKEYKTIENLLKHLDKGKYIVPDGWKYKEARNLFLHPDVTKADNITLEWKKPNEEELLKYLVTEKHFNEERVKSGIQKMKEIKSKGTQGRLDSFFKVKKAPLEKSSASKGVKRPGPKAKGGKKK
ncbi:Flap endonuclease, putative [Entamoeba invadens IP1]|uniref:Flap endonuclease, putative n=1 Tax=Entamoeba invadens IP1 TaxID=370355 RepID=UPI0002C3D51C|nr:Flap endonuclease, putative [Entamoeba invadens IP1]ELP93476.1 Flap endonuclease, putative [Entamoeba invadens IP1]|eukprot:XP_004260247.1 Flap endonuclease, putative [Entamoeba invadens IP1]